MHQLPALVFLLLLSSLLVACGGFFVEEVEQKSDLAPGAFHDLSAVMLDGSEKSFADWKGSVVLVVNVASECGFTDQYEGLQKLQDRYKDRGLIVAGFPCNDFGGQEPGSAEEIQTFCTENFGVTFPLFAKVGVKAGTDQSPVYGFLGGATGKLPGWNFGKYLVGRGGEILGFFDSRTAPLDDELLAAIEKALG